jgi:hypothetical protein
MIWLLWARYGFLLALVATAAMLVRAAWMNREPADAATAARRGPSGR